MKTTLSLLFIAFGLSLSAQIWVTDSVLLNFPQTDEKTASTKTIWIKNYSAETVEITDVDLFQVYGKFPFKVDDTSFVLQAFDSTDIEISFRPQHNIEHDLVLVLKSPSGFGHRVVELDGQGIFSNSYYQSTRNQSEENLKSALNTLLAQGYSQQGYTTARDKMYGNIDNDNGVVEDVYTGRTATFNTRSGANDNSFNCEHTFPQSMFGSSEPMQSDIHHLFPCDVSANSVRSNHPFGVVSNPTWSSGGSKYGSSVFEPRDVHKGDAARAMMYFVIRYQDYSGFFAPQESILRTWHNFDTVSTKEFNRNQDIYSEQNNRNPFVDYPQFEQRITNLVSNSVAPISYASYFSDDTIFLAQGIGFYDYTFVIYNNGNELIQYGNFALNGTDLSFTNGDPGFFTLYPGEYITIDINYNSEERYQGNFLTFDTQEGTVIASETILIESGSATVGIQEQTETTNEFAVFPNPAKDYFEWSNASIEEVEIIDAYGRLIQSCDNNPCSIDNLTSGFYIIKAVGGISVQTETLLVK